uniref:Retrovirus-related Pol polyprotein from transposon TNT 1-94 n=1 Tax=Tanacetum cinerariifolium TaxID=118510 RepID=A0A699IJE6_TANCI|nr:retrovirus-related Pol polyprotein from transposon TNT 1-94 [Tanacetum cinerariifolium]
MLCYLAEMKSYYLKCIKDGPFQPKTADGDVKPGSQWTPNERMVVVQDQRLKSIIISCLPDDIMKSVISCVSAKETWTDLVHSFQGPSDTKENKIMDLKLEYQIFRAKFIESLSQTYTHYKTLLNELANDGVKPSKHESILNPDSKLPNFNTGRILVPESQVVNESLNPTEASIASEISNDTEAEPITPLPPLNILQGASPSSKILYCMICKREDHWTSDHEMYIASLKRSENYKARPYQYASLSKRILKAKAKPFPPCTHYCFNDHRPDDYRNYTECEIYRSYDHFTLRHNRVIQIRGGVLVESSQSNESSIGVKCDTCGSIIHSISDHNEFDYFKRDEKIQATKAREPTKKWVHKKN